MKAVCQVSARRQIEKQRIRMQKRKISFLVRTGEMARFGKTSFFLTTVLVVATHQRLFIRGVALDYGPSRDSERRLKTYFIFHFYSHLILKFGFYCN